MKNFFKGKFGTIIIVLFTLILASVAIFTALRLYQLRQQPVAPNVPSSIPRASENACSLSFTVTPQTPGLNCTGKFAHEDDSRNAPPIYYLDNDIPAGTNVAPGQTIVYAIDYENTGNATTSSVLLTDVLPTGVDFADAGSGCTYESSTRTVTCSLGGIVPGGSSQKVIRVTISTSASAGSFTNTATLSATGVENSECEIALNVQTSTGSPTPTPTVTPSVTPTATPNSCGGTCGSNANCGTGFYCYTALGLCRNPSCPTDADCTCPGSTPTPGGTGTPAPTPTPTVPALPVSGTDWPTIVGAGIGIFVIIGSLLLAL
jgi:uncharacterized repeat protein (TIGR01451 family)